MVALGFGKFARADRIYALERITGENAATAAAPESGSMESPTR
jgi:hypothetical protein